MATPYQEAMRRRLHTIDDRGSAQTTWQKLQAQREAQLKQEQQAFEWQKAYLDRLSAINSNSQRIQQGFSYIPGGGVGNPFENFVSEIAKKESNNNYGARNSLSGAMGKYQIMPSNITGAGRGWDYEALGYDVSPAQFMKSPQIQEQIARYKLQEYYNKYGPAGASIAWYAGPAAAQKYANTGYASTSMEAGGYPSVQAYMNSIMGGL